MTSQEKEEALKLADRKIKTRDIHQLLEWADEAEDMIRKLVAELDKQGEPVAWNSTITSIQYAPQTKPLSDEEIS